MRWLLALLTLALLAAGLFACIDYGCDTGTTVCRQGGCAGAAVLPCNQATKEHPDCRCACPPGTVDAHLCLPDGGALPDGG